MSLFADACRSGDVKQILKCIEDRDEWNANYDCGMVHACEGGNMDIVKLMIEKGANSWNDGLVSACLEGHLEIVKFMIEKCLPEVPNLLCGLRSGLRNACFGGHLDVIKFMIEKGADCKILEETPRKNCCRKVSIFGDKVIRKLVESISTEELVSFYHLPNLSERLKSSLKPRVDNYMKEIHEILDSKVDEKNLLHIVSQFL